MLLHVELEAVKAVTVLVVKIEITVANIYDQNGFMFDDVAHMSSDIATANEDGTYTVSMGCGDDALNNLPISNDTGVLNFIVRHYIPSERVKFDGYRLMPQMQKVD